VDILSKCWNGNGQKINNNSLPGPAQLIQQLYVNANIAVENNFICMPGLIDFVFVVQQFNK